MVRVLVSNNNTKDVQVLMESNATLAQAFEAAGISTANAVLSVNGCTVLNPNATFAECGVVDSCSLWAIVKQHNAA